MRKFLPLVLVLAVAAGMAGLAGAWSSARGAEPALQRVGVVDVNRLLQLHPSWPQLAELDQQLQDLQGELNGPEAASSINRQAMAQMSQAQQNAAAEFFGDVQRANAAIRAEQARLEKEYKEQIESIRHEFEASMKKAAQAERQAQQGAGPTPGPSTSPAMELTPPAPALTRAPGAKARRFRSAAEQHITSFAEELITLEHHRIAAKSLDLQNQSKKKLDALQQQLTDELAAYVDHLAAQDQHDKLNLQLKLSVANDEDKPKLEDALNKITQDESRLKQAKQAEIVAAYEKAKKEEFANIDRMLRAYKAVLDREVRSQIAAEGRRVGVAYSGAAGTPARGPNLTGLRSRAEQAKADLERRLKATIGAAKATLAAKKAELNQRLKTLEQRLTQQAIEQGNKLQTRQTAENGKIAAQLKEAQGQRDRLFDRMMADISDRVATVATERRVAVVLGDYILNVNCEDLTDLASVEVRKISESP